MVLSGEKCGGKETKNGGGARMCLSGAAENTERVFNALSGAINIQGIS